MVDGAAVDLDAEAQAAAQLLRRISFHPETQPFSQISSNDFYIETLNPSPPPNTGGAAAAAAAPQTVPQTEKRSSAGEFYEHGFDHELSFRITFGRIGAGLENLGNTCFLNSVLQCLTYTEPFAAYLQSGKHKSSCHTSGFCAMCALQNHVRNALQSTGKILSPFHLVKNLRCISRNFRSFRQEDAHEYMINLLESMHKCCLPSGVPSESPGAYEKSLVHKIFGGCLRSQVKCTQCYHSSNKFDPFLDLSLEIAKADSVRKALAHFTAIEQLDGGERQYQCEHCKEKVTAQKQLSIHKAPYVLTVHLKRFSSILPGQKIDKRVEFEPTLDLGQFVSDPKNEFNLKYTLYGVLVHAGWSIHSGHYYCFVRTSSGMWHSLDDNQVRQVSAKAVFEQKAYMLFYVRDRGYAVKKPVEVHKNYIPENTSVRNMVTHSFGINATIQFGVEDRKLSTAALSSSISASEVASIEKYNSSGTPSMKCSQEIGHSLLKSDVPKPSVVPKEPSSMELDGRFQEKLQEPHTDVAKFSPTGDTLLKKSFVSSGLIPGLTLGFLNHAGLKQNDSATTMFCKDNLNVAHDIEQSSGLKEKYAVLTHKGKPKLTNELVHVANLDGNNAATTSYMDNTKSQANVSSIMAEIGSSFSQSCTSGLSNACPQQQSNETLERSTMPKIGDGANDTQQNVSLTLQKASHEYVDGETFGVKETHKVVCKENKACLSSVQCKEGERKLGFDEVGLVKVDVVRKDTENLVGKVAVTGNVKENLFGKCHQRKVTRKKHAKRFPITATQLARKQVQFIPLGVRKTKRHKKCRKQHLKNKKSIKNDEEAGLVKVDGTRKDRENLVVEVAVAGNFKENLVGKCHQRKVARKKHTKRYPITATQFARKQLQFIPLGARKSKLHRKCKKKHLKNKKPIENDEDPIANGADALSARLALTAGISSKKSQNCSAVTLDRNGCCKRKDANMNNDESRLKSSHGKLRENGYTVAAAMPHLNCLPSAIFSHDSKKANVISEFPRRHASLDLIRDLKKSTVPGWDDTEFPESQNFVIEERSTEAVGHVLDEWDLEYDRGKKKKRRKPAITFDGRNLFQEVANKKARETMSKRSMNWQTSSRKEPFRI